MVNDPFGMGLPSLGDRDVAETVTHFRATVYVSLAGIVLLLYDHILTFADEIQYVWKSRMSLPKVLFLFTRYAVPITVIVSLRAYSGISQEPLSDKALSSCKGWSSFSLIMGALAIASSNFIVLLRLWVIWERRITLVGWTLAMFFVTQLATLGMAGWIISQLAPSLRYSGAPIRACVLLRRVNFVGLWAPGVAFEVVVFVMTWWNAFERPRTDNQELRTALYRDGTVYFMTIFSLRLVNLILAIIAPITLTNIGMQ
ncbi:hypothetical protein OF83DRAFT_1173591 [Amylostereum chailletii]|nr:hypothetical protein OF83DRAFT_1173591 [Amylostereum chailletii]